MNLQDAQKGKIKINISGQSFVTTFKTLLKYPTTKLGRLSRDNPSCTNYFFESDPEIFKEVLKFYHHDELHIPRNVCYSDFTSYLKFWDIDQRFISECCALDQRENEELERQFQFFEKRVQISPSASGCQKFSYSVWCFLTDPGGQYTKWKIASKVWAVSYLIITLFSGTLLAVFTVPSMWNTVDYELEHNESEPSLFSANTTCKQYKYYWLKVFPGTFLGLNGVCFIIYSVEIWIRFLSCPDKKMFWRSMHAVDMTVALLESVCFILILITLISVLPNLGDYQQSSFCVAALYSQLALSILGQLRYIRLLTYASVYRYDLLCHNFLFCVLQYMSLIASSYINDWDT